MNSFRLKIEASAHPLVNEALQLHSLFEKDHSKALIAWKMMEKVLARAEQVLERKHLYQIRLLASNLAGFSGRDHEKILLMCQCAADEDAEPDIAQPGFLMVYKGAVLTAPELLGFSRKKIDELVVDFVKRASAYGHFPRATGFIEFAIQNDLNTPERDQAKALSWNMEPRDPLSHCEGCEPTVIADYYIQLEEFEKVLDILPLYDDPGIHCGAEPRRFFAKYLYACSRLGRPEEGEALQPEAYRMIRDNQNNLRFVGQHIFYFTTIYRIDEALALFDRHLGWTASNKNQTDQLVFWRNVIPLLLNRRVGSLPELPLHLPQGLLGFDKCSRVDTGRFREAALQESFRLAELFDRRNGNTFERDSLQSVINRHS